MNTELGRKVLDHVTAHPAQLDMCVWGRPGRPCGTSACLAGWALIFSGWDLVDASVFRRESDGYEIMHGDAIETEARRLLDLSDDDYWRYFSYGDDCLFTVGDHEAAEWLRELVEKAEADRAA